MQVLLAFTEHRSYNYFLDHTHSMAALKKEGSNCRVFLKKTLKRKRITIQHEFCHQVGLYDFKPISPETENKAQTNPLALPLMKRVLYQQNAGSRVKVFVGVNNSFITINYLSTTSKYPANKDGRKKVDYIGVIPCVFMET